MRQLYIRKLRVFSRTFQAAWLWQHNRASQHNCAERTIQRCFLLHIAEFSLVEKNLIFIGKVFSYLNVILPNMGNRTGGECD